MSKQPGIYYEGEFYGWNAVYMICGLCKQDFDYDPVGSMGYFEECLTKWEDK